MIRLADRKRQRREYLRQVRKHQFVGSAYGLFFVVLSGAAAIFASAAAVVFYFVLMGEVSYGWFGVGLVVLTGICGWMMWLCWKSAEHAEEKAGSIPYVPAVTLDTLPAEEVLVRGSDQPSATSETLLRSAKDDAQKSADRLLRATNGAESNQP